MLIFYSWPSTLIGQRFLFRKSTFGGPTFSGSPKTDDENRGAGHFE